MSRANVPGTVYLIHFCKPYQHAAHYLGWTEDLEHRLAEHRAGRGARLMAVIKAAGIDWTLARTWPGTRARERQLKEQGGHSRKCPECGVKPQREKQMTATHEEQRILSEGITPEEAAELQDTLERGYKAAYELARQSWGVGLGGDYETRFQTAAEVNDVAADVVHETLGNGMRRPGEATEDFKARVQAEADQARELDAARNNGADTAHEFVLGAFEAGMPVDEIERRQQEIITEVMGHTETGPGKAFAAGYRDTAEQYVRELREMDQPGLTPGDPHPDPGLAAKGWRVSEHGTYARHPEADAEPEAG